MTEVVGLGHNAQSALKNIIDRVNNLEDEKAETTAAISEVYAEAKAFGLDPKIVRKAVRFLRMDKTKRDEEQAVLELYLTAVLG